MGDRPRLRRRTGLEAGEAGSVRRHLAEMRELERGGIFRPPRRRFWRDWSWLALAALAFAAYGLAVAWGEGSLGGRMLDALRLFPSGFPGSDPDARWQLVLAKHLAALVSLFVTLRVLVALFADKAVRLRAGTRRGHAVVCGLGEKGRRSARAFRAAGAKVTCVDLDTSGDAAEDARACGALVLKGDATQLVTLRGVRIDRADHVVCTCGDDATNARIAVLAARLAGARAGRPVNVYAHVGSPELARLLRGPALALRSARLHFFNVHDVWARALLEDRASPVAGARGPAPTLIVLGAAELGSTVVVGAARRWHGRVRAAGSGERLRVVLVDSGAAQIASALSSRYPAIVRVCELEPVEETLSAVRPPDLAALLGDGGRPAAVYVCLADRAGGLALALQAERQLAGRAVPILVPAAPVAAELGGLLLGGSRVRVVSPEDGAGSLDRLHDSMREAIAAAVHEAYLADRTSAADFGSRPGDRPWDELPEEYRRANRHHADALVDQLLAVWYEVAPRYDWDEPVQAPDEPAVEALAELEHERWRRERLSKGWRYGQVRDDVRRVHDLLVSWEELSERDQEVDRALVRAWPRILAEAGFRLERSPTRDVLARALHERYLARGEDGGPAAVTWPELPDAYRELNRAHVDHIAVKLARLGWRVVPADTRRELASFAPDELEGMSELEHERWVAERLAGGWRPGPRDDGARTHPNLVPWSALDEEAREKDRELVRAVPELLASVGLAVARTR